MEYIQKFRNYLFALKNVPSNATVKNYCIDVKHFISWSEDKLKLPFEPKFITLASIEEFRKDKAQQLSARSLDRHISSLRKFFYCLKLEGIVSTSPFEQTVSAEALAKIDPYHMKEFKDFL